MSEVIIIILTLLLMAVVVCSFIYLLGYVEWRSERNETAPAITFSALLKFYSLAPERWTLREEKVYYLNENNCCLDEIEFKTFHDFLRYKRWKASLDKQHEEKKRAMNTAKFIKSVQKDINDYEEEYMEVVKKVGRDEIIPF